MRGGAFINQQVDLTNCDREPIHIPGSVQPFGFLLALLSDFSICIASANVADHLGVAHAEILQRPMREVFSESAVETIRTRVDYLSGEDAVERMFGVRVAGRRQAVRYRNPFLRRLSRDRGRAERRRADVNSGEMVRLMLGRVRKTGTVPELAQESARQMKMLTGFDRVMVYRFHPDGSGEVIAEVASGGSSRSSGCTIRRPTFRGRPASFTSATGCASSPTSTPNRRH